MCDTPSSSRWRSRLGVEVRGRILQVHAFERVKHQVGHGPVAVPLAIGGHNVPRRKICAAPRQGIVICLLVGGPVGSVIHVGWVVLPELRRIVQPLQQPPPLLLERYVQHHFHQRDADVGQLLLKIIYLRVPAEPHPLRSKLAHARHQHVLVVRTVEYPDEPGLGQSAANAPEEVVAQLGRWSVDRSPRCADPAGSWCPPPS